MDNAVRVRRESFVFPTYEPAEPDRNPMFLEKRVYQGSSGRVYPLPFFNRISETPTDREWDAIFIENGLVEVMLLPEIGGRVHAARDLTNDYEMIYRQNVIKPALVGLGGPWASGGIEFNWPQHHRPSTFMPADVAIEHGEGGSITVWMGEHEPMDRTKGMHGICLYPDRSVIEIKVRLYNRTPYVQTFLWWSNIGTHVHEGYKSFFPPDAHLVADHAKRAISTYPLCDGHYYGVDYADRAKNGVPVDERPSEFVPAHSGGESPEYAPNDLSWYANIPVPTSYMCVGTKEDFVGGYDHFRRAGLLHVCDHHIAPGKKQWTWGNHDFGYSWDRNLTDADGPYIELMAGVYTDNQPDFSYIAPGETRTFSQYLYAYQEIGPVHYANIDAAISVTPDQIGIAVTRPISATIVATLSEGDQVEWIVDLAPDKPFVVEETNVDSVSILECGSIVAHYQVSDSKPAELQAATEPPHPTEVASSDELYVIGQHLWQYRHATRNPADYWREAIRRDAGDLRCNNGLGLWHFRRGEFEEAEACFRTAITRATSRNPNPYDGEPYYNLGLTLRFLGDPEGAMDAFGKAAWNAAWQAPSWHAMGELASSSGDFGKAISYLDKSIRKDQDNLRARSLRVMLLRKLGKEAGSEDILALDPLDHWAGWLSGHDLRADNQVRLDLTIDLMRAGLWEESLEMLRSANSEARDGTAPMLGYYEATILMELGQDPAEAFQRARHASPDYCFPARLEDIAVLKAAPDDDGRAAYYLGNLLYDRRRHQEAIAQWEKAVRLEPTNAIAHRNLGIAYYNVLGDVERAKAAYDAAVETVPNDARYRYERDQLWKRIGVAPELRFEALEPHAGLISERDDLTIEYCALLNAVGRPGEAAEVLSKRQFQPWEGGEGMALGIWTRTQLALARSAENPTVALEHLQSLIDIPKNLGEARHLLANASDVWLALGDALTAIGETGIAESWYKKGAYFKGDFQGMAVQPFSEYTYFQALALRRLGDEAAAERLMDALAVYAEEQLAAPAKIDYFATSLPTMLLFEDDLKARQDNRARFIQAQIAAAQGNREAARGLLSQVLSADPNHALASDLLVNMG